MGWDGTTLQPLEVRHDGNYPIQWWTDNIQRMRLTETLTGQAVNGYTTLDLSGHLGIGNFNAPVYTPLAMLHLDSMGSEVAGYRSYMGTGVLMTSLSDMMYVGLKRLSDDRINSVINWADNAESDPTYGPDALTFVFTSEPDNTRIAGQQHGLEVARMIPAASGNEGFMGIGDFQTAGLQPTERLDLLDGKLRIRQLPTDAEANTLNQYMVVDTNGIVKWRTLPPSSTTNCDWQVSGNNLTTAWRPVGTNGSCPDANWKLGIGVGIAAFKLDIRHSEADGVVSGGVNVDLKTNSGGTRLGIRSLIQPMAGGSNLAIGYAVRGITTNVGLDTTAPSTALGVSGESNTTADLHVTNSMGVYGGATASAGQITNLYGGQFYGNNNGGTVTRAYGVSGRAANGSANYGVYGEAGSADPAKVRYGVYGVALGLDDPGGAFGHTKWAGYFQGNTYVANLVGPSDEQLKQNIEALSPEVAVAKLQQLAPKTYDFRQDEFGFMHLPTEHQYGLISQEVEAVLPELVTSIHQPAMLDSAGVEVGPEIDFKALNYQGLTPLLIAGFQAQQQQLDQQQATIAQMQDQLNSCCEARGGMVPQGSTEQRPAAEENELQEQRLMIIPNPVADLTKLEYYVPKAGKVSLLVSTSDGKPLATLREEMAEAGAYTYSWNTTKLAAGTYFCTFMLDGAVVVKRAVKVK